MSFDAAVNVNLAAWVLYSLLFIVMLRTRKRSERQRDSSLRLGMTLQIAGAWAVPLSSRPWGSPLIPSAWSYGSALEQCVRMTAVVMAYGSIWLTISAIRTLGKQWSLSARVVENHQLIRTGPYGWVRHPIYTALLGMTTASALTVASWPGILAAAALSALGSWIRVHSEERLMRETFGAEYVSYARSVPALVPWLPYRRAPSSSS